MNRKVRPNGHGQESGGRRFAGRTGGLAAALACVALESGAAVLTLPLEQAFELQAEAEVVATITASCNGCSWQRPGSEAAVLALQVDGRYSQHLFLTRGEQAAPYRVALGRLEKGRHSLRLTLDARQTPAGARKVVVDDVAVLPVPEAEAPALARAPVLYARPDTVGRFSDVPLVMWYETDTTERGTRLRYSVIFSNEDGGTPSDRLMATWGRLTDIEYVYGVELDREGRVLAEQYQGPGHKFVDFKGAHEAGHPLMYVVTENNMVSDRKKSGSKPALRFALVPSAFDLTGTSREALMDENPWTYRVSALEARREGRVREGAPLGSKRVSDPRRYATLEACAPAEDATLSFAVGVRAEGGDTRWFDSSGGLPNGRIGRKASEFPNGCFRGAVALPPGVSGAEIVALRFRAFTRIAGKDEPSLPKGAGRARLERVNKLFLLDEHDEPGPSLFSWRGSERLVPEGPFVEVPVR